MAGKMKTQCPKCLNLMEIPNFRLNTEVKCTKCQAEFVAIGNEPSKMTNLVGFRKIWFLLLLGFLGEILIILGAYGLGKSSIKNPQTPSNPVLLSSIAAAVDVQEYYEKLGTIQEIRAEAAKQCEDNNLLAMPFFSTLKCTLAQLDSLRDSINSRNIPNNPTIENAYRKILKAIEVESTFEKAAINGTDSRELADKMRDSCNDALIANINLQEEIIPGLTAAMCLLYDKNWHP